MLRAFALLLVAAPVAATPITFTFSGTWYQDVAPGKIQGVSIQAGDPFEGSFTFERLLDGTVLGELDFALGPLEFLPLWLVEYPFGDSLGDGWGSLAALTATPACRSRWSGEHVQCLVTMAFTGPRSTGCGGAGLGCHHLDLYALDPLRGISGTGAWSNNVELGPYLPFGVAAAYTIPEPASISLVGIGLLLLFVRWNKPAMVAGRYLLIGAIAGAVGVLVAVWRLL